MLVTTAAIAVVCGLLPGVARAQITRPEPLSVAAQIDAQAFTRVTAKGGHEYLGTLTVQPDSALIVGGARLVADSIVRIEVRHKEGDSPLNSVAYVLGLRSWSTFLPQGHCRRLSCLESRSPMSSTE